MRPSSSLQLLSTTNEAKEIPLAKNFSPFFLLIAPPFIGPTQNNHRATIGIFRFELRKYTFQSHPDSLRAGFSGNFAGASYGGNSGGDKECCSTRAFY
jgi:hypothetical protein